MSALAPTMQAFFTERLIGQRQASPHTIAAYRDTFRLLLAFAQQRTGVEPHALDIDDIDASLLTAFLDHLERDRGNNPRTRNARLAAVRSLYRYAALRHPEHAATIARVLAIPTKRHDRAIVCYLGEHETAALLGAPDRTRWIGRRDHALMTLTIQTGLRVSELIALRCQDAHLAGAPHIQATGKGRKQRITPLTTETTEVLRRWTKERAGASDRPLFPTSRGRALSRDAVALLVSRHAKTASRSCPTLATKTVTPHVLRHTAAMNLLHAGVDTSVIALWLGHESTEATQIYLHADMAIKERALARTTPVGIKPGRYRPADALLAFLERL
jgi:integrase/recombinase XerD